MLNQKQEELLSLVKGKDELEKEISDLTNKLNELNKKGKYLFIFLNFNES